MASQRTYRFDCYEADTASRALRKRGLRIPLGQKGFEVLLTLLERPGEVVTRQELRARLWPDARFLEFDNAINSAVHRLRDALCDPAEQAKFVETLPSVGYRFIAALEPAGDAAAIPRREVRLLVLPWKTSAAIPPRSISATA